ncbi:aminopeptidase N [Belonocnema kinseyi]|uniref:aminopeptidase N n=1 Tax=Belonocnema kinseyi TaxID=2817044 RepID=UPI00143DD55E|nr:aminopeptidase N [Belonocnema kinseyi]
MRWTAFLLSAFLLIAASNAHQQERYRSKRSVDIYDIEEPVDNRLPRDTKPSHYYLEIQPFLNETKFKGRVRINVTWVRLTDKIVLNVDRDLEILHTSVKFTSLGYEPSKPEDLSRVSVIQMGKGPKKSWYTINFNDTLMDGANCEVDITYYGNMSTLDASGLFRNDYIDSSGIKQYKLQLFGTIHFLFFKLCNFQPLTCIHLIYFNKKFLSLDELLFRMFNYTLGKENFRAGIRDFLQKVPSLNPHIGPRTYFYSDFYKAMNDVANKTGYLPTGTTLSQVADPWMDHDRLPLVTVKRDYDTGTINITQKRYHREGPSKFTSYENGFTWYVPLVIISQERLNLNNTRPTVWLLSDEAIKRNKKGVNVTMNDFVSKNSFIIANPEEIGPFPVNYDTINWRRLAEFLQGPGRESIQPLTRAKLFHDSWNLAYANELCFDIALNMTLFLKNERNHVVWEPVFTMIDHIGRRIHGSEIYIKFQAYIRSLLKPLYMELSENAQPDEPSWKTHMRGLSKIFLCRAGYEPCIMEARKQFNKWLTDEEPDKGNPVANEFLCPVFKWGTEKEWEFGLQRVINFPQNNERKQSERTYLLKTLAGCPTDDYKIKRLLNVTIIEQNPKFSTSDIHLIASTLTGSATGYTTLFNFLAEHWDVVKKRFEDKPNLWSRIINTAISSFNTQEGYDKVSELYASRQEEFKSVQTIIEEALENIKRETQWSEKNFPVINAWLDKKLTKEDLLQSSQKSTNSSIPTSQMMG